MNVTNQVVAEDTRSDADLKGQKKGIVFVHRYALIREAIARLLQEHGYDVTVLCDLEDSGIHDHLCDIGLLLLDWEVFQSTPDIMNSIIERNPDINIAVLTQSASNDDLFTAFSMGIKGYLSFHLSAHEFVQTISTLQRGDMVVTKDVTGSFLQGGLTKTRRQRKDGLSEREMDVLRYIGGGSTNREIAEKLFVSEHTVKVHLRSILNKLTLRNRQQIAAYAAREGLTADAGAETIEGGSDGPFPEGGPVSARNRGSQLGQRDH